MSKVTVEMIMNQIFCRRIFHEDMSLCIYEPRISKTGSRSIVRIDKLYPWLYFSDFATEKQKARQHKYDTLEADWRVNIPSSPTDVRDMDFCIELKERFTKPRISTAKKEADKGEG